MTYALSTFANSYSFAIFLSFVTVAICLGTLIFFLYQKRMKGFLHRKWQLVYRDIATIEQALPIAEKAVATHWQGRDAEEFFRKARNEFAYAREQLQKGGGFKFVRHGLDESLWWLGNILIPTQPEYVMEMIGDRDLLHQLFNRWDNSMPWSWCSYDPLKYKIRWKRFKLYQEIKNLIASGNYFSDVLANAQRHLEKTDFPAMLADAKGLMELAYLDEGLRFARAAMKSC